MTFEPSKLRLCHDERFLNLWIRDVSFNLDHLPDLPRYVHGFEFRRLLSRTNQMSLDSNCRKDKSGNLLPHFSLWPTPNSSGVNVCAQPLPLENNVYVFPPFVLVGPLLRFFFDNHRRFPFTIIVPRLHATPSLLVDNTPSSRFSFQVGKRDDLTVLHFLPGVYCKAATMGSGGFPLRLFLATFS